MRFKQNGIDNGRKFIATWNAVKAESITSRADHHYSWDFINSEFFNLFSIELKIVLLECKLFTESRKLSKDLTCRRARLAQEALVKKNQSDWTRHTYEQFTNLGLLRLDWQYQ